MYKKQNNAKCEIIFLLRPAKEREYINMKELKVARGILVADMLITFYIVLGVKAFEISFFEHSFIDLIISWFPVIMLGIVAFIYSFYMCSKQLLHGRKFLYIGIIFLGITVVVLMLPKNYFYRVPWIMWLIVLLIFFALSIGANYLMEKEIKKLEFFSVDRELLYVREAQKKLESSRNQRISKWFSYVCYLYIVPFIISANSIVFLVVCISITAVEYGLFLSLWRDYDSEIKNRMSKHSLGGYSILFGICVFTAVVSYIGMDFKLLAFASLFATALPKYMCDNKAILVYRDFNEMN